jgi:hypothetical protein
MRIELDTTTEGHETVQDIVNQMVESLPQVTATILTDDGPAGWPVVAYDSDDENALREIARRYGGDTEETVFPN